MYKCTWETHRLNGLKLIVAEDWCVHSRFHMVVIACRHACHCAIQASRNAVFFREKTTALRFAGRRIRLPGHGAMLGAKFGRASRATAIHVWTFCCTCRPECLQGCCRTSHDLRDPQVDSKPVLLFWSLHQLFCKLTHKRTRKHHLFFSIKTIPE